MRVAMVTVLALALAVWLAEPHAALSGGPPNDSFSSAVTISSLPFTTSANTSGASLEPGEPRPCASKGSTVWYRYTPSTNDTLTLETEGSTYDTALAVYRGTSLTSLTSVACDDDGGSGLTSRLQFFATGGTNYYFQVGGFSSSSGDLRLSVRGTAPATLPHRKVIYLSGINSQGYTSCSPEIVDQETRQGFDNVKESLRGVIADDDFVWFSYKNGQSAYCNADHQKPLFAQLDTCDGIDEQNTARDELERLVTALIQEDPEVKVDIVAHSMGGLVAAFWAQDKTASFLRDHVHSIVTLDSPLSGAGPGFLIEIRSNFGWVCDSRDPSVQDLANGSAVVTEILSLEPSGANALTSAVYFVHINSTIVGDLLSGNWREAPPPCRGDLVIDLWQHGCMLRDHRELGAVRAAVLADVYDNRDAGFQITSGTEWGSPDTAGIWVRGSARKTDDDTPASLRMTNVVGSPIRILYSGSGATARVDGGASHVLPNSTACQDYPWGHDGTVSRPHLCYFEIPTSPGVHTVDITTIPNCFGNCTFFFFDAIETGPLGRGVDVALIIDSSGSKFDNDPANQRLDAARAFLTASLAGDRVAVVDFSTRADVVAGLQATRSGNAVNQQLISSIDTIGSGGLSTNIRAAIEAACDELSTNGQAARRGAILLTDGLHNEGTFGDPQECFANNGWPIYTFGFGDADEFLLQTVANDTGGEFRAAPTSDFVCEFQRVRSAIAGLQPAPCTAHQVNPGSTTAFMAAVPPSQGQATFSTSWCCSDVVMSLQSPSGRTIDRSTEAPDVIHDSGSTFEIYTVLNPEPGDWRVSLFGADLPDGSEDVIFGISTLPAPPGAVGDVDCDEIVSPVDAALILQLAAGLVGSLPCQQSGDVNGDGNVDTVDAALILQFTAGLINALPP